MPYEIPFKIGDEVTLRAKKMTYKGREDHKHEVDQLFGLTATVESLYEDYGIVQVLFRPEDIGRIEQFWVDAWCFQEAGAAPTDEEIAEAFGLIGMPAQEEEPSDGHLKALHRLVQEGEWAQERLAHHLGPDWRSHFEESS